MENGMELTEKTFKERLKRLEECVNDQGEKLATLDKKWREKGVECAIIIPLIEIIMEFDFFNQVEFELSSTDFNNQRMDFVLDGKFIIEAKRLCEDIRSHIPQIDRYMKSDSVKFAILTNGIQFMVFIKVDHISEILYKLGARENIKDCKNYLRERGIDGNYIKVLDINYIDIEIDYFLSIFSSFSPHLYKETFDKISRYILAYYSIYGKKNLKLHTEIKIDKLLKKKIEESIPYISKGYYHNKEGFNVGDVLVFDEYEDEGVKIFVRINKDWGVDVMLERCDYNPIKASRKAAKYRKVIDVFKGWVAQNDISYVNPAEIIKEIKGNTKIMTADANRFVKA